MIDLSDRIVLAQIAFALAVIAFVVVYYVFGRDSSKRKK